MFKKFMLLIPVVVLIAALLCGVAAAYFTSFSGGSGTAKLTALGTPGADVEETEVQTTYKTLTFENTSDVPVFVRAAVITAGDITAEVDGWTEDEQDGYWYRDTIVAENESVQLTVNIAGIPEEESGAEYDVDVMMECTAARYMADGTAYASWNGEAE